MRACRISPNYSIRQYAGVLLFHARPGEILPQVGLEMARFRGTRTGEFLDKSSVDLPAWKLYGEALTFIHKHLPVQAVREEKGRTERLAYSVLAFRELMINAVCHRSYEPGTGPVRLAVFDDLIEITNSGPLPEGLELSDLGTGISVLRNPILARPQRAGPDRGLGHRNPAGFSGARRQPTAPSADNPEGLLYAGVLGVAMADRPQQQ